MPEQNKLTTILMPEQDRLIQLTEEIDAIVDTAVSAPTLTEPDVRRVLRFISQVIQLVEQAFQDVLTLLIDIKLLKREDLNSPRLDELRRSAELLTARSHYRDAAEICSRLRHLGQNFNEFIRPSVANLPNFAGWKGVFGLIEEHEGRIIQLVEQFALEIGDLLRSIDSGNLDTARQMASSKIEELRSLLKDLRDLNSRILGFSGSAGFLEMTTDRTALQREVKILVDKSVTHGHRVGVGSGATFHGDFVVATNIQDSFKKAQSASDPALKDLLQNLCKQVEQLLPQMPPETRNSVSQDLSTLVTEAASDKPRRRWYELSADGLIEAAKTCAGMASPIITTVKSILSLLG